MDGIIVVCPILATSSIDSCMSLQLMAYHTLFSQGDVLAISIMGRSPSILISTASVEVFRGGTNSPPMQKGEGLCPLNWYHEGISIFLRSWMVYSNL